MTQGPSRCLFCETSSSVILEKSLEILEARRIAVESLAAHAARHPKVGASVFEGQLWD